MKRIVYILVFILTGSLANGQYNLDYGFKIGASNFLGEMGGKEKTRRDFVWDMKLSQTRYVLGGFIRYRFNPTIFVNASLMHARISGDDALSTNRARTGRNLSFRNDLWELAARGEIVYLQDNDVGNRGRRRLDMRLFVFAGIGGVYHNPKALYEGSWHKLRPLNTEALSKEYSKIVFVIPKGLGVHFTYKRKYRFGWEMGWRTTFTDYLDDASTVYASDEALGYDNLRIALANRNPELENANNLALYPEPSNYGYGTYTDDEGQQHFNKRGDPTHNDSYLFTNFTYSYVWRGKSNFYRQKYGWLTSKRRRGRKSRAKF